MSIGLSQTENLSEIRLDGEVGIEVAAEPKASLLAALEAGHEIRVSLEGATTLDVTTFQLLWATEHAARQKGLEFTVTSDLSQPLKSWLEGIGLEGLLVGPGDPDPDTPMMSTPEGE